MILILSNNQDQSTNLILEWLNYYGEKWFRINETDNVAIDTIEYQNNEIVAFSILVNNIHLDLMAVKSYWYRRGFLNVRKPHNYDALSTDPKIDYNIKVYLKEEIDNVNNFIHSYLRRAKVSINSFLNAKNDKSYYLYVATQSGLSIPDSLLCCTNERLQPFAESKDDDVITKDINEMLAFPSDGKNYFSQTKLVSKADIKYSERQFFPSFFQKYIPKFVELRIFYLNEETHAMAIFSQQNEKTKVDFRDYDDDLPNRNVPFLLPDEIKDKIIFFMNEIQLNCGSIDMILTPDDKYYFLEVNPIGQFGMVSIPCNYQLEKKIANHLAQAT